MDNKRKREVREAQDTFGKTLCKPCVFWIKKQPSREGCFVRIKQSWWGRLGLNQRPTGYEPAALTAELRPRLDHFIIPSIA